MPEKKIPAVFCKNLKQHYGEGTARVEALRGVNLEVPSGTLNLLMGPSGSGKTTLISVIAGILTQESGECLINGTDINHLPDQQRTQYRAKNLGFVFQIFNLIPMLTNEENISIPLVISGTERKTAIQKSKHIMQELGLGDKIGMYPAQLSGGQQQRIAIARALAHEPSLVVCDEPTSFLDHVTGQHIMELLRQMVDQRKVTVVVVTHDPRIVDFADKIDYVEDGSVIKTEYKK
jgi:putative ABC transport system ATP-binding protein